MRAPHPVVTIDGPAGAGKSTVARQLAARLGFAHLSSGAIYRAVAWRIEQGTPLAAVLADPQLEVESTPEGTRVRVEGEDVSAQLSAPRLGELASTLSQNPEVRRLADRLQRAQAERGPVVVEGRDAGSVVFPWADCKFYLDASLDARARRLAATRGGAGGTRLEEVRAAIAARDLADRTRALAPLTCPNGATCVDSTGLSVEQVVERMAAVVERTCSTWC